MAKLEMQRQDSLQWWASWQKRAPELVLQLISRTSGDRRRSQMAAGGTSSGTGNATSLLFEITRANLSGQAVLVGVTSGPGLDFAESLVERSSFSKIHLVARWSVAPPTSSPALPSLKTPENKMPQSPTKEDSTTIWDPWSCPEPRAVQDIAQATDRLHRAESFTASCRGTQDSDQDPDAHDGETGFGGGSHGGAECMGPVARDRVRFVYGVGGGGGGGALTESTPCVRATSPG